MKLSISMTRRERLLGWSYLLFSMFVLPYGLGLLNTLLPAPLSPTAVNLLFFAINFLAVVGIFHTFLRNALVAFFARPWRCLLIAGLGLLLYFTQMLLISFVIVQLQPDFSNVNDAYILQLSQQHHILMSACTVLLVPVTEELLYRGLVLQSLYKKSKLFAFCLSVFLFGWVHVMGYVGLQDWKTLLLCFLQYLPAGITLSLAYAKSDSIVTPILIHIAVNLIGTAAMR